MSAVTRVYLALAFLGFAPFGCVSKPPQVAMAPVAPVFAAWILIGPEQQQILRVVTDKTDCPLAQTNLGDLALQRRTGPPAFATLVCEATLPTVTKQVSAGSIVLHPLSTHPKRILVLGDTGCRVREGLPHQQACNDLQEWPFANVAESAAAQTPDLIIHVGDYHYREGACPEGNPGCHGATPGDNWTSWNEDFVAPAKPLLQAAPWIFVRGNHELCDRGGLGWFALLESRPWQKCADQMPPFSFELPGHQELWVIDAADDQNINPSLTKIPQDRKRVRWALLHRPILTPGVLSRSKPAIELPGFVSQPGGLDLTLVGHFHILSLNTFKDGRSPEFIVGHGGTQLDVKDPEFLSNPEVSVLADRGFGFATLQEGKKGSWTVTTFDDQGHPIRNCDMQQKVGKKTTLHCH